MVLTKTPICEFGKKAEEMFTKMAEGVNADKDFSAIIKEI